MISPAPLLDSADCAFASVASLLGDPGRAAMLAALLDGRALPAGDLARVARVGLATASAHLRKLVSGGCSPSRRKGGTGISVLPGRRLPRPSNRWPCSPRRERLLPLARPTLPRASALLEPAMTTWPGG